ncbi:MAG: glutathionylspermidine synthase family protein [Rhodospirillaceae bacterium]|nr:glutathionylspermidine synthase family protein [Rhodospirillaceae bacterium]
MQRISVSERSGLAAAAAEHGFEYAASEGVTGWDESGYYQFTMAQIQDNLAAPAEELEGFCFELVERAVNDQAILERLGIGEPFWDYLAQSWRDGDKNLTGRMDLSYDGTGPAKLLEYNADTPTALYETAVFQWEWLEQAAEEGLIPENCDQFNDVHEAIVQSFAAMSIEGIAHFACNTDIEDDKGTLEYLEECAKEAGLKTHLLAMNDIGLDDWGKFTDTEEDVITTLVKLYPWEWIMDEEFGLKVPASRVRFIEPPWKAILSNKGMLALLWEMFEGHPNLLPTFFEGDAGADALAGTYVRKPLLGRQGANIQMYRDGALQGSSDGPYGDGGQIVQGCAPLPDCGGRYPLLGLWLIASKAAGLCIREGQSLITGPDARTVPHVILD